MMVDWTDPGSVRTHIQDIVSSRKNARNGGDDGNQDTRLILHMLMHMASTMPAMPGAESGEDKTSPLLAEMVAGQKELKSAITELVNATVESSRVMRESIASLESAFMSEVSLVSDDKGKRAVRTKK